MRQEELTIHKALPADGDWKSLLFQPLPERDHYETAQGLSFSRLAGQILGTPIDETDYYNELYELSVNDRITILSETLDKTIEPENISKASAYSFHQSERKRAVSQPLCCLSGRGKADCEALKSLDAPPFKKSVDDAFTYLCGQS